MGDETTPGRVGSTADGDDGGEAPCLAPLLEPAAVEDSMLVELAHAMADALVIADAEGNIVLWNAAAEALFGWSAAEAMATTLDLIIPERLQDRHWEGYRRVMATGVTSYGGRLLEVPALHRDGHRLSIAFTVTLLGRVGSAPRAIAAVIRDDTERRAEYKRLADRVAELETGSPRS